MALEPPLWASGPSGNPYQHSALLDRRLTNAIITEGVLSVGDLFVLPRTLGANMSVDVTPGSCVIPGTSIPNQGKYICRSTATENLPVAAAPGSGTRVDLVVARVADSEITGVADGFILEVLTGTTTVPNDAIGLATITVPSGTASITANRITNIATTARLRNVLLNNMDLLEPTQGGNIANKTYVDNTVNTAVSGSFGMLTSGTLSSNSNIIIPSGLTGNYIELILRGRLAGSGEVGCAINVSGGGGNLGYDWVYTTNAANGARATYQGTADTTVIVARWSTVVSMATIRVYFATTPSSNSSFRIESTSSRHSNTTSLRWSSHHTGRALTAGVATSLYIASRGASWDSTNWQLNGFRA